MELLAVILATHTTTLDFAVFSTACDSWRVVGNSYQSGYFLFARDTTRIGLNGGSERYRQITTITAHRASAGMSLINPSFTPWL